MDKITKTWATGEILTSTGVNNITTKINDIIDYTYIIDNGLESGNTINSAVFADLNKRLEAMELSDDVNTLALADLNKRLEAVESKPAVTAEDGNNELY